MSGIDRHRNVRRRLIGRQRKQAADAAADCARWTVIPHRLTVDHAIRRDNPGTPASQYPGTRSRKIDVLSMVTYFLGRALVSGGNADIDSCQRGALPRLVHFQDRLVGPADLD